MSFGARVPVDYGDGVPRETAQIVCDGGCGTVDGGGGLCPPDWIRIGGSGAAILHFCPPCAQPVAALLRGLARVARPMGSESREPEAGARPVTAKHGDFATRQEALDAIAAGLNAAARFGVEAQRAAGAEISNPETARVSFEVTLLELLAERRRKALPDAAWSDEMDKELARDPYAFLKRREPQPDAQPKGGVA